MSDSKLIAVETICVHYKIEQSFLTELDALGLLRIFTVEQDLFVKEEQVSDLEKIIRLHHELNLNLEAIDVVFNLLEKQKALEEEVVLLRKRLRLYE
jgi:hypothetical protein